MKKLLWTCAAVAVVAGAFARPPNYDESKVGPYTLEDPLTFADGRRLKDASEWPARRQEILEIFAKEMYGQPPPPPEAVVTETVDEKVSCAGYAIRRQFKMWFRKDRTGPCINWILFRPRFAKGPVPVVEFLNYRGNHELTTDKDVPVMQAWSRPGKMTDGNRAIEKTRGIMTDPNSATYLPLNSILARGYAVLSACYCEISPDTEVRRGDKEEFAYTGVFDLWPKRDPSRDDNITSLGAWAWAFSRGVDYIETDPALDAKRIVATGCSRLAKTPLLACARDPRIAVCAPVQTGGGGCPLAKRDYGENVSTEMASFPHWYCRAYGKYVDNEQAMKFDQHLLLASIAPRALLVLGFDSGWFDTKGEYLAVKAASPAWTFLGKKGMPDRPFPNDFCTSCIGPDLGYVRRSEEHGISAYDWQWMLDFADGVFARR